jgi:predicted Zn-dependent protease
VFLTEVINVFSLFGQYLTYTKLVVLIFDSADISTVVCHETKVPFLMANAERCQNLKRIIKIGNDVTDEEKKEAKEHGIEIVSFAQLEVI